MFDDDGYTSVHHIVYVLRLTGAGVGAGVGGTGVYKHIYTTI